jgi:hypothetical protein
MGQAAPFAAPNLHRRLLIIATSPEKEVILAERFCNTTSELLASGNRGETQFHFDQGIHRPTARFSWHRSAG